MRTRGLAIQSSSLVLLSLAGIARGQVVLDGSLGPAGMLPGPNVIVPASAGTTVGSNLFHSFSRFDIPAGESVTFDGPDSIHNVLARVTGGHTSLIDGRLRCSIPGADLYLINPSGVVFGATSSLEVRGSFAVTSASYIRLGDGPGAGRFDAFNTGLTLLVSSPPAAFGFLGDTGTRTIDVRGNLGVPDGRSVSIVGGDAYVTGGEVLAASGTINLASVVTGEAVLSPSARGPVVRLSQATDDGARVVQVVDGGVVDASGPTPGLITIRGGTLNIQRANAQGRGALVVSNATGAAPAAVPDDGLAIDIELTGGSFRQGAPGPARIGPAATVLAVAAGGGAGGGIRVVAGNVDVDAGGAAGFTGGVATSTAGPGRAGNVDVVASAGPLRVIDGADVGSTSQGTGRGGDITLTAPQVEITGGGQVFAQARAAGDGGNVRLTSGGAVTLDGPGSAVLSSTDVGTRGNGGRVDLAAAELRVSNGAFVSATTNGSGDAGDIAAVIDGPVELDGAGLDAFTGLGANTQAGGTSAGRGGTVSLQARSVAIREGAGIAARTFGGQDGGNINLTVTGDLLIDATRTGVQTGLNAQAAGANVNGGRIDITASSVQLRRGQITASADGDGGEIQIAAPVTVHLIDSEIVAEAGGNGGNVSIDPVSVILQRSRISANAIQGNGGNIDIRAQAFIPSADPQTAVTASSQFGLVGTVDINAPDTEIAGALVKLPGDLAAAGARLLPQCGATLPGTASSFVATGRGGAPPVPGAWQASFTPAVPKTR